MINFHQIADDYIKKQGVDNVDLNKQIRDAVIFGLKCSSSKVVTPYNIELGDLLILNDNELEDELVSIVDLTGDGVPFCIGDNFEGYVPMLKHIK